ncbi:hypothetical protein TNCV_3644411 [Trichonephila clavipes]|nr:hypothetical protein TNCV_3644411 [Trichonephila clavipes]
MVVGSLVVRATDSRPEDLGLIPDATKYPPSTHGNMSFVREEANITDFSGVFKMDCPSTPSGVGRIVSETSNYSRSFLLADVDSSHVGAWPPVSG